MVKLDIVIIYHVCFSYLPCAICQLFEEAKWRPAAAAAPPVAIESPLDPALGRAPAPSSAPGHSMASRIEKSEGQLKQFRIFHESSQSVFGAPDVSEDKPRQSPTKPPAAGTKTPEDIELLDTLPKSLSDIYNISNRNRSRNKDKKRNRDSSDATAAAAAAAAAANVLDAAQSSQSTDWYHVEKDTKDHFAADNVEGTLDFAKTIGWMGSDASSRDELRKKHLSNESNNNYSINVVGSSSSQEDHMSMSGTNSVTSSFDSKKSGAKAAKQTTRKEKIVGKDSNVGGVYDYSRASGVNSAMGAMSTVNTGTTDRDAGKYNPFLTSTVSQGGNGGYSNASNRSNNNNASKPRKQQSGGGKSKHNAAVIERRDTNRSHIFSAPSNK
jgi:hypothetical protein